MEQIELQAKNRDILGKGVRFLRRQGITPVHLFGHNLKSLTLQCETTNLERSLVQAGAVQLMSMKVDSETQSRPVLVREVQRDSLSGKLLHVDFYQVKMGEKVEVEIPIVLAGEAPALKVKGNRLIRELDGLTVECLPNRIPASLELNISSLSEPGQALRVKDIAIDSDVTVPGDREQVVVRIIEQSQGREVAEESPVRAPEEAKQTEERPKNE